MNFPGLEEVSVTKAECIDGTYTIHVACPRKVHQCPLCGKQTSKVHDYRLQKIQHLKIFERYTQLFYRKRRYACSCGKRFAENTSLVDRYQRQSKEWNQAIALRVIKGKTFKETADIFHTSSSTVIRRFDAIAAPQLKKVKELPSVIAIDEYKGDTDKGKYQVIIADAQTREPLDILPDRSVHTVKRYLREKGNQVEMVVMDMSHSFKSAVRQALGHPIIIADRFHFCRYIYWALERVRRSEQHAFHAYDRKKCKRMKHIFYKAHETLSEKQKWYLDRYLKLSGKLKRAYQLKETFRSWFEEAKQKGQAQIGQVKEALYAFYQKVEKEGLEEFIRAKKTLQNWQKEILNSFAFSLNNGFVEGLNNQTKVIKRNGYGYRSYERLRLRILLHHQFKDIPLHIG
ncbi:MAG TPA: ISL3 family transposase [Bacillales bacterium]